DQQRSRSLRSFRTPDARNTITMPKSLPLRLCALARETVFVIIILASPVFATRIERQIDSWKPEHYLVNITLNENLSEIASASTRIDVKILKPTRVIDLDFGELTVDRVTMNSNALKFTHDNGKLLIDLPGPTSPGQSIALTIDYHGKPKDGL